MNFLLEITKDDYASKIIDTHGLVETLGFGGTILLVGMVAVFAVLGLLLAALMIFNYVFHGRAITPVKSEATVSAPVIEQAPVVVSDDGEIIAAIAAAIAMAESETTGLKYRVVSFKRK